MRNRIQSLVRHGLRNGNAFAKQTLREAEELELCAHRAKLLDIRIFPLEIIKGHIQGDVGTNCREELGHPRVLRAASDLLRHLAFQLGSMGDKFLDSAILRKEG